MPHTDRQEQFQILFPHQPSFRWKQIEQALFQPSLTSWQDCLFLSKDLRQSLTQQIPFLSLQKFCVQTDEQQGVYKAILTTQDQKQIETVLIKNSRGHWTLCISTQIGCAMKCAFCATGKMGLARSLHAEEIVDQYRFWQYELAHLDPSGHISNLVYMGMGEPFANYEHVKSSLHTFLAQTEIGETKITVSTVGIIGQMEKILIDSDWPRVRIAISLHSVDSSLRKKLMPSSCEDFLEKCSDWSYRYLHTLGNRTHHLTFEYILLKGINDRDKDARSLASFVNKIGKIKVNLIPYNTTNFGFFSETAEGVEKFKRILEEHDVTVTVRRSVGTNIQAACGQLIKDQKQTNFSCHSPACLAKP